MCEPQFETETWKQKKKNTEKTLDTHTTKTKWIFSQGLQGCTPSPHPALLWEAGWEPEEGGQEGDKAEPVRKEAVPGPDWKEPQSESKTCFTLQSI